MGALFVMRFDFRNPAFAGTTPAQRYEAALEMAEWGDRLGCLAIALSEHHGSADGYLPSPLPLAAAIGARTSTVRITIAALLAPFYDPLRLAEDLLVLDHLTRGRIDLVIAAGYVADEFELYGIPMRERVARVTEAVTTLQAAFTGEPFEYRGRSVHLTPAPYGCGPSLSLGGSSDGAARRAARLGVGFLPAVGDVWDAYRDEVQTLGGSDPGPCPPTIDENRAVFLAEDVEAGWSAMAPYLRHEMESYGAWQVASGVATPYRPVADVDELRASGRYAVLTPDELVKELEVAALPLVLLHPLCGGMPIDLAWSSLRLFEHEVIPALAG